MSAAGANLCMYPEDLDVGKYAWYLDDDFAKYVASSYWTKNGTLTAAAVPGGPANFATAASDNGVAGMVSALKNVKFGQEPFRFRMPRTKFTEATSTADVSLFFGFADDLTVADILADNTGATDNTTPTDICGFIARAGGTANYLSTITQRGASTTRQENALTVANAGNISQTLWKPSDANYRDFSFRSRYLRTGVVEVVFMINDKVVSRHEVTYASAAMMGVYLVIKTGTTTAQSFICARVQAGQMYLPAVG